MNRILDVGLIELIRSMLNRLDRLESQNDSVRKNDIRLGQMVVTTDPIYNRVGIQNVKTKEKVYVGDPSDAVFSYSGNVVEGSVSPAHVVPQPTVAREIVVTCLPANTVSFDTEFLVHFDDASVSLAITLNADESLVVRGINVPMGANQRIYVECTDVSGAELAPADISVFVRFGTAATSDFTNTDV